MFFEKNSTLIDFYTPVKIKLSKELSFYKVIKSTAHNNGFCILVQ